MTVAPVGPPWLSTSSGGRSPCGAREVAVARAGSRRRAPSARPSVGNSIGCGRREVAGVDRRRSLERRSTSTLAASPRSSVTTRGRLGRASRR